MDLLRIELDWLLIIVSTGVLLKAIRRMTLRANSSIGNYAILITWAFCCLPILFDYLVGAPEYRTVYWYAPFIEPMANDEVSCIYDTYILASIIALHFYCNGRERKGSAVEAYAWSTPLAALKPLLFIAVILPFGYILVMGLLPNFLSYGSTGSRDLPEGVSTALMALQNLSLIAFCVWFFAKKEIKVSDLLLICIFSFATAWFSGKRFVIALMIVLYLYFFLNRDVSMKVRRRLQFGLPVVFCLLLAFSAFYLVEVKPLSDTSSVSVYDMLRVDYGRDDVLKYVIYHEFFLDDHILDYPGQTFLSTFLVWVPRFLWPLKPYQHYQYLTSSILGLPIERLPAGTTPSWWEMSVANFSYFGFIVGVFGLVAIVAIADRSKTVSTRATALVLVIALMTQSIDAYISLVLLLMAQYVFSIFVQKKKTKAMSDGNHSAYGFGFVGLDEHKRTSNARVTTRWSGRDA